MSLDAVAPSAVVPPVSAASRARGPGPSGPEAGAPSFADMLSAAEPAASGAVPVDGEAARAAPPASGRARGAGRPGARGASGHGAAAGGAPAAAGATGGAGDADGSPDAAPTAAEPGRADATRADATRPDAARGAAHTHVAAHGRGQALAHARAQSAARDAREAADTAARDARATPSDPSGEAPLDALAGGAGADRARRAAGADGPAQPGQADAAASAALAAAAADPGAGGAAVGPADDAARGTARGTARGGGGEHAGAAVRGADPQAGAADPRAAPATGAATVALDATARADVAADVAARGDAGRAAPARRRGSDEANAGDPTGAARDASTAAGLAAALDAAAPAAGATGSGTPASAHGAARHGAARAGGLPATPSAGGRTSAHGAEIAAAAVPPPGAEIADAARAIGERLRTAGAERGAEPATGAPTPAVAIAAPQPGATPREAAAAEAPLPSFPVTVPVHDPRFGDAFGERVTWMVREGLQSAELTLHPQELGPIRIELSLDGDAASIGVVAAQAETRGAIEQALPRLRELLAQQGLQLGGTMVDGGTHHPGRDAERGRDGRADARATSDGAIGPGGLDPTGAPPAVRAARAGRVDVFA
jgi:flagellar hook-length control protein FliK